MEIKTKKHFNEIIKSLAEEILDEEDLDEITAEIFERCADERYVLEFGQYYNKFLDFNIKEKMRLQIDYEWYVESCEDEYRTYPIKFKLKYSHTFSATLFYRQLPTNNKTTPV